jgi:hypothetical protein
VIGADALREPVGRRTPAWVTSPSAPPGDPRPVPHLEAAAAGPLFCPAPGIITTRVASPSLPPSKPARPRSPRPPDARPGRSASRSERSFSTNWGPVVRSWISTGAALRATGSPTHEAPFSSSGPTVSWPSGGYACPAEQKARGPLEGLLGRMIANGRLTCSSRRQARGPHRTAWCPRRCARVVAGCQRRADLSCCSRSPERWLTPSRSSASTRSGTRRCRTLIGVRSATAPTDLDFGAFNAEEPRRAQENWQAPWMERWLELSRAHQAGSLKQESARRRRLAVQSDSDSVA